MPLESFKIKRVNFFLPIYATIQHKTTDNRSKQAVSRIGLYLILAILNYSYIHKIFVATTHGKRD